MRFSNEGWNELLLHNHSIRWLIGDIETENKLLKYILHPISRPLIVYIVLTVVEILVNAASGTLIIRNGNVTGYFQDFTHFPLWVSCILTSICIRYMLGKLHNAFFSETLLKGDKYNIHRNSSVDYQDLIAMKRGSGCGKWIVLAFGFMTFMTCLLMVYLPLAGLQEKSWGFLPSEYPLNYAVCLVGVFITFVLIGGNLAWYGIGCTAIGHKMLDSMKKLGNLKVIPVSPDGQGGFYVLAQFAFSIFLLCMTPLPFILAWIFTFGMTLGLMLALPFVLFFMVFAFFYPLWPAHSIMKSAKKDQLDHISELFEECYNTYVSLKPQDRSVSKVLANMNYMQTLYDRARKMPVWPFNMQMLTRFLSLILLPFITFLAKSGILKQIISFIFSS